MFKLFFSLFLNVFIVAAVSADLGSNTNGKSCDDLYQDILDSECARLVSPFLKGASLKVGASFHGLNMDIQAKGEGPVLAKMAARLNPSPYASLELSNAFIGNSNFGYSFGLTYLDSYALDQTISRDGKSENIDLGTYVAGSLGAVQPALFYVLGGRDNTPNRYLTMGLGASFGFSYVRGNTYLTEARAVVGDNCFAAGLAVLNGQKSAINQIKSDCPLISYDEFGFGMGGNVFISGRWSNWQADLSVSNMILNTKDYRLTPNTLSLILSYVINL